MSGKTTNSSPSKFQVKVEDVLAGFENPANESLTSLTVQGTSQESTAIVAELQAIDARYTAVGTTKDAYEVAVADRKAAAASDEAYVNSVVASLKVQFEGDMATLKTFGIDPAKPKAAPSTETKIIAATKAAATRAARGTMGKKQRQEITATPQPTVTVAGINTAPAAAPAADAPAAPPATGAK